MFVTRISRRLSVNNLLPLNLKKKTHLILRNVAAVSNGKTVRTIDILRVGVTAFHN